MVKYLSLGMAFLTCLSFIADVSAHELVYPVPPPNDTSLELMPAVKSVVHIKHTYKHKHKIKHGHKKKSYHRVYVLRKIHPVAHHKPRPQTGFFEYDALSATACCGETWQMKKANCCATWGEWQTSPYSTFHVGDSDIIHSATNDDEFREFDPYFYDKINDTIEDPR